MANARKESLAKNEATFRTLNEAIETQVHARLADDEPRLAGYVCECGDAGCAQIVRMTIAQYESVRRDPHLFLIAPGHEIPEVEDVVLRDAGFAVVRKHADVGEIVRETNPRP